MAFHKPYNHLACLEKQNLMVCRLVPHSQAVTDLCGGFVELESSAAAGDNTEGKWENAARLLE